MLFRSHCVVEAQKSLHALTGLPVGTYRSEAERLIGQLRASLDYADIEQIMRGGLHEYVDGLQVQLNSIGEATQSLFFDI